MIYTSYFARIKNLPKNAIPIAICGGIPDWYKGFWYKKVAPKYKFFQVWKQTQDNDYYIKHFKEEVLDTLDPHEVVNDLFSFIRNYPIGTDIVLICYEKPEDFCHRHLVADWLNAAGYNVKEYEF